MPHAEPLLYLCRAIDYIARAHQTEALGEPPEPPTGEWVWESHEALAVSDEPVPVNDALIDAAFERAFGGFEDVSMDGVS